MPGPWGRAIMQLRNDRNLTQRAVAKRAKMTPTTYGRIERGQHTQTRKLQDIADVFGVSIEQVLHNPLLPNAAASGNTALSQLEEAHHERRPQVQTPPAALFSAEDLKAFAHELGKQFREAADAAERAREREVSASHKPATGRHSALPRKRRSR